AARCDCQRTSMNQWPPCLVFRSVLLLLCLTTSLLVQAQGPRSPVKIGELWGDATEAGAEPYRRPYLDGMRSLGWVDGRTAKFLVRYAGGDTSRLPVLAKVLLGLGVDVLVVNGRALPAARMATTTIPIVSLDMWDPVAEGVTSSLAKPTGNVTGVSWQTIDTAGKRLELARELLPGVRRIGLLTRSDRTEALIISTSTLTIHHLTRILKFASSSRLPTVSEAAEFAEAGVLLTYGPDVSETYKRGALQVDKILKGKKPDDLPFEKPKKFELAVNLNTAKVLGLTIPESIMVRDTRTIR